MYAGAISKLPQSRDLRFDDILLLGIKLELNSCRSDKGPAPLRARHLYPQATSTTCLLGPGDASAQLWAPNLAEMLKIATLAAGAHNNPQYRVGCRIPIVLVVVVVLIGATAS